MTPGGGPSSSARVLLLSLLLTVPVLTGCLGDAGDDGEGYSATIRWTSYGIPHIEADGWDGLGYGYGYAAAKDYLCVIAEEYVTTAGQRSMYFGPEEGYGLTSNGQTYTNRESDLFFSLLDQHPDLVDSMADHPSPELDDLLDGYVAGYNRYLQDTPVDQRPAGCRGEPWVQKIAREDVVHRVNKLNLIASMGFFAPSMVAAQPPTPGGGAERPPADLDRQAAERLGDQLPSSGKLGVGSNGYAFGSEMTADGRGMLMGNPHFPWMGPERFHQLHLTIPGEVDVMGTTLLGVPLILIGFNDAVAWTHTVSTGWRFSLHELRLAPDDPTAYVVDGQVEQMEKRSVTVDLGEGENVTHTFYLSRYGPIIDMPVIGQGETEAGLTWENDRAYALNDMNARNDRTAQQFLAWNQATSFDGFVEDLEAIHGIPWVNTIAASPDGRAFYGDVSVVPNYDAAKIQDCNTPVGRALFETNRLPVFDGSRSACAPTEDPEAAQPGIIPADQMPSITTRGWLMNSNDDAWLPNPEHPLDGYSPMVGPGPSERSTRTRMGYVLWQELEDGASFHCQVQPEIPCDKLTLDRLQHALFADRLYVPEQELDTILQQACTPPTAIASSGQAVDLTGACQALADWDRRADTDSAGLPLFERFWLQTPKTWTVPFDEEDPVHTPRGFLAADPRVRTALADAVLELQDAGIPLDATAGEARYVERGGERLGLHGAAGQLGSPSMLVVPFESGEGFEEPVHGNSYIQTVTWDAGGTPVAEGLLTYSQSPHEDSPHRADQTRLYADKRWVELPFTDAEIQADPNLETLELS